MKRIQRRRTKGWKLPPGCVYVGRPTKWGNPFRLGIDGDAAGVVKLYRLWALWRLEQSPLFLDELRGKDLACWCGLDQACHADVLLELCANLAEKDALDA